MSWRQWPSRPARARLVGLLGAGGVLLATSACTPAIRTVTSAQSSSTIAGDWAPGPTLTWQIQLTGTFDDTVSASVYDLDPYATPAQTIDDLRAHDTHVMCHVDIGVADPTLPDAARLTGPILGASATSRASDRYRPAGSPTAGTAATAGWWLDIREWSRIEPVLADRLKLCVDKGFDGVDADGGYGYVNTTGFALTPSVQVAYDKRVVALAHRLGLAIGVRSTPSLAGALERYVDFAVASGCFEAGACLPYFDYVRQGKAVFVVETAGVPFCALAHAYGFAAIRKTPSLNATVAFC